MPTPTNPVPPVPLARLVLPFFRVILTRLQDQKEWGVVVNPQWNYFSEAESSVLHNDANDYVEHANCGCVYRMIRASDWTLYVTGELDPDWTLDPRQNANVEGPAGSATPQTQKGQ